VSGTVRVSPFKGDRDLPPRFRTIQVYPKDVESFNRCRFGGYFLAGD